MKTLCQIYKSSRREEMYLYVDKSIGLAEVPEPLLKQFGEPIEVMTLLLGADRKLARANAAEVMENIREKGFFLQMPPTPDELRRREAAVE